jgi:predicted amidohydrolase YtcJ
MSIAVNRTIDYGEGEYPVFLPDQRIDLMDALAAFTAGTAWVNHLEGEVGSIEVGKTGDFAVIDRDLFDRAAGPIHAARVVGTFIDGASVFEDPALDG